MIRVERDVGGPRTQDTQDHGNQGRRALGADRHARVRAHAQGAEPVRQPVGAGVQLRVRELPAREDHRRLIDRLGRLTPRGIRTYLGLNKPIYRPTAAYGHFGRQSQGEFFPWEKLDLVEDLKAAIGAEAQPVHA